LEGLAALVGMQAVNDQRKNAESKAGPHPADLWYFGPLDGVAFLQGDLDRQPEGIGDPNRPQTYSRGRVYQLLHDVTLGADVPPKPDGDSNALRHNNERIARQVGSIHTHTVAFIEPSDGVTAAKEAELALSWALDDALARVGRRHGSHDDAGDGEGQPAAGWMRRWVAACTRASFSYSFTTAGCNLIASTVQLIETDLPTFFEMEHALEVLVGAAEQATCGWCGRSAVTGGSPTTSSTSFKAWSGSTTAACGARPRCAATSTPEAPSTSCRATAPLGRPSRPSASPKRRSRA
jgi:hypothetical protein